MGDFDTKVDDPDFVNRITEVIDLAGGPAALVKKTGLSRAVVDKYRKGADPSRSRLMLLADAAGVNLLWLATGSGPKKFGYGAFADVPQEGFERSANIALVPVMNVVASAGKGAAVIDEQESGEIGFRKEWLHRHGLSAAELFTMPSTGESMEPTIKAGEYLLCSKAEHHLQPGDGIFVVRLEGDILVKRLQRLPGAQLSVMSDNKKYAPFIVDLNDGTDFKILGRVVFVHGARRV